MAEARIPTSVAVSLGLHGGLLVFFGLMMREAPKQAAKVVEGVDLIIQQKTAAAPAAAVKPPPLSTFDFLKLALPTPVRAAAPAQLDVKIPEHKVNLAEPKLQDSARKDLPKLQALDLSEHRVDAAKLDVKMDRRHAAAALAALPRLEDVGRRRVKNLPQALELEDRRREAVAAAGLPALDAKPTSRRQAAAAVAALQEAAPPPSAASRNSLSSLLAKPALQEARPQAAMDAPKLARIDEAPKVQRRQAAQAADVAEPKKGVEIEGPLADRKIRSYSVPPFPDYLKSQGVLEADVAIRFTVDEDGNVMPGMRVTSSSGYGRVDRLAMDALKVWRFVPAPGAGIQWGVITFRFVTE